MRGAGILLLAGVAVWPAAAHNLDEYVQAALLEVGEERVGIALRLTPGPLVYPALLALADRNGDGKLEEAEAAAYVQRAAKDWSLEWDGEAVALDCRMLSVAPDGELREGMGSIRVECAAGVGGGGGKHEMVFRNGHQAAWSSYLMNALRPEGAVRIEAQKRDERQSEIRIGYVVPEKSAQWAILWATPLVLRLVVLGWERRRLFRMGSHQDAPVGAGGGEAHGGVDGFAHDGGIESSVVEAKVGRGGL